MFPNMRFQQQETGYLIIIALAILMGGIFIADVSIPLGVAAGIPYVAAVLTALRLRKAQSILFVAAVCTFLTVLGYFLSPSGGIHWMVLANRSVTIFVIWVTAILLFQRKQFEQMLRALPQQLIHFQDIETERISHEIHEDIAQSIVALKVSILSIFAENKINGDALRERRTEVARHFDIILDDARQLSYGIHPSSLSILGLTSAIQKLVDNYRENNKWNIELSLEPVDHRIKKESAVNFYRILQAALSNVEQSADADSVQIKIRGKENVLRMTIKDNGKSFVPPRIPRGGLLAKGLDLAVMTERVRMLGGELSMSSNPGNGTTVEVLIPIRQLKDQEDKCQKKI